MAVVKLIEATGFHLDHSKPLASGGKNGNSNMQVLCKYGHLLKCKEEQENHEYVKIWEASSSFNQQVYDVITDKLPNVYSFVETVKELTDKTKTFFEIDMNKSKKQRHRLF